MLQKAPTAIICLSPNSGGMEIDAIKLAKKLSPFMPIIVVAQKNKFIAQNAQDYVGFNGIELETIKFSTTLGPSIIYHGRKIAKKHHIKNVIFFGASELKSLYFSFLGLDINLIVRHGTTKNKPKKDWFHRLIYSNAATHVSICEHLRKNVEFIIPFGKNTKEKMIYSSLDFEPVKHLAQPQLTLLHIGRIAQGKGQTDAIAACEVLYEHKIPFKLYLVGGLETKYSVEFNNFLQTINYKEHIELVGYTKETPTYLAMADIFLFPSWGEGLSNAFIEALASNIPSICYNNTSFPELQNIGLHFQMVEDRNISTLKQMLLNVITHIDEEREASKINYSLAMKRFSLQQELNNYLEILQ